MADTFMCQDISFWDPQISWYTEIPTFTRCFRRAIFSLLPNAVFWLILPFYVYKLKNLAVASQAKISVLSMSKIFLAIFLLLLSIIDFCYWILDKNFMGLDILDAVVRIVTFSSIIAVTHFEVRHGHRISGVQFMFWTVLLPLHFANAYCEVADYFFIKPETIEVNRLLTVVTSILTTVLVLASLVCHFFVDSRPEYERPGKDGDEAASSTEPSNESPILNASFPSKLVFSWFTGFAWMGFKRSLGFADLYDLPPFVPSGNVVPRFLSKWNQNEIPKSSPKKSSTPPAVKAEFTTNGGPPEVKIIDSKTGKEEDGQLKKRCGQCHCQIFRMEFFPSFPTEIGTRHFYFCLATFAETDHSLRQKGFRGRTVERNHLRSSSALDCLRPIGHVG